MHTSNVANNKRRLFWYKSRPSTDTHLLVNSQSQISDLFFFFPTMSFCFDANSETLFLLFLFSIFRSLVIENKRVDEFVCAMKISSYQFHLSIRSKTKILELEFDQGFYQWLPTGSHNHQKPILIYTEIVLVFFSVVHVHKHPRDRRY